MVKYCRKKRPHWGRGAEEAPSDPRGRLSCTPAPGTLVPGLRHTERKAKTGPTGLWAPTTSQTGVRFWQL